MTVADVGAHIRYYTLLGARQVGPGGRVHAFETDPWTFALLRRNVDANLFADRVTALPVALSNAESSVELFRDPANAVAPSFAKANLRTEGQPYTVRTTTLDAVLAEQGVRKLDVVKMDVQGAEEWVLLGAKRILTTMHPIVIFESWPAGPPLLGLSPNGAWDFLDSLGYEFFVLKAGGSLIDVKSPPVDCNVVAIHTQSR